MTPSVLLLGKGGKTGRDASTLLEDGKSLEELFAEVDADNSTMCFVMYHRSIVINTVLKFIFFIVNQKSLVGRLVN